MGKSDGVFLLRLLLELVVLGTLVLGQEHNVQYGTKTISRRPPRVHQRGAYFSASNPYQPNYQRTSVPVPQTPIPREQPVASRRGPNVPIGLNPQQPAQGSRRNIPTPPQTSHPAQNSYNRREVNRSRGRPKVIYKISRDVEPAFDARGNPFGRGRRGTSRRITADVEYAVPYQQNDTRPLLLNGDQASSLPNSGRDSNYAPPSGIDRHVVDGQATVNRFLGNAIPVEDIKKEAEDPTVKVFKHGYNTKKYKLEDTEHEHEKDFKYRYTYGHKFFKPTPISISGVGPFYIYPYGKGGQIYGGAGYTYGEEQGQKKYEEVEVDEVAEKGEGYASAEYTVKPEIEEQTSAPYPPQEVRPSSFTPIKPRYPQADVATSQRKFVPRPLTQGQPHLTKRQPLPVVPQQLPRSARSIYPQPFPVAPARQLSTATQNQAGFATSSTRPVRLQGSAATPQQQRQIYSSISRPSRQEQYRAVGPQMIPVNIQPNIAAPQQRQTYPTIIQPPRHGQYREAQISNSNYQAQQDSYKRPFSLQEPNRPLPAISSTQGNAPYRGTNPARPAAGYASFVRSPAPESQARAYSVVRPPPPEVTRSLENYPSKIYPTSGQPNSAVSRTHRIPSPRPGVGYSSLSATPKRQIQASAARPTAGLPAQQYVSPATNSAGPAQAYRHPTTSVQQQYVAVQQLPANPVALFPEQAILSYQHQLQQPFITNSEISKFPINNSRRAISHMSDSITALKQLNYNQRQ